MSDELMERFFIEHGTIHDRKTGRHVRTDPEYGPNRTFGEDGIEECCALLNQLALAGFDREIELRAQLAQVTKELDEWRDRWSSHGNNLASIIATAVEALEWYAITPPSSSLYDGDRALEALAAIRGKEEKT